MAIVTKEYIKNLFLLLEEGKSSEFFDHVVENVEWQVEGTHPLAGIYKSKSEFVSATFDRLGRILKEGVVLRVHNILLDGSSAAIEMVALSHTNHNVLFDNHYCWVTTFNDKGEIVRVRAYLDSALVADVIVTEERIVEEARLAKVLEDIKHEVC